MVSVQRFATRAPSVAAKLRLMARQPALAVLGTMRARMARLRACTVVEPIGIEPMT